MRGRGGGRRGGLRWGGLRRWGRVGWIAVAITGLVAACGEAGEKTGSATSGETGAEGSGDDGEADGATDGPTDGATGGQHDGGSTSGADEGSTSSPDTGEDDTSTGDAPGDPAPRYDRVQQKSTHNAYQRQEAIIDQLVYHRVRSIELDLHVGKTFEPQIDGDWYVYHTDITDDETSCRRFSDCLGEVQVFAEAVPEHEVVTLWIDLKDDWDDSHAPADLDAQLQAAFGDALYGPGDLLAACPGAPDLAAAARDPACGWPTTSELRGRIVVALTGGGVNDPASRLSTYAALGLEAFVAPDVTGSPALDAAHPSVAIYNAGADELPPAQGSIDAGFVTRIWGLNDAGAWAPAAELGAQHLATDMVNLHQDAWTITHDADGWPFRCTDGCAPVGPEAGAVIGVQVDSGDIWGAADDFWFSHVERGAIAGEWTALVSSANSHVEPFAKGCLMARAGLSADAPYFAVCRPADEEPLRVQLRPTPGAASQAIEHDVVPGGTVAPSSVAWLRLLVDDTGACVTGQGARHFGAWVTIATHCFGEPLTHRGLATSSHDAGPVRILFVSPSEDGIAVSEGDLDGAGIGGASAVTFSGAIP